MEQSRASLSRASERVHSGNRRWGKLARVSRIRQLELVRERADSTARIVSMAEDAQLALSSTS